MGTAFYDDQHKRQKLNGTICLYKGIPYHIDARSDVPENMVRLIPIDGKRCARGRPDDTLVDYRSPDFDYKATPLGYTNYNGAAYYMARCPDRISYQGLYVNALCTLAGAPLSDKYSWFLSKEIKDCILGKHPTLEQAEELIFDDWDSCAFDRHFAVARLGRKSISLMSRGRVIGSRNIKEEAYTLIPGKDKEHLMKVLKSKGVSTC